MANKPVIRSATLRDLIALTSLEKEAFRTDRFSEDQIEYLITRAHSTVLILESKGRVAGSAYLLLERSFSTQG